MTQYEIESLAQDEADAAECRAIIARERTAAFIRRVVKAFPQCRDRMVREYGEIEVSRAVGS